MMEDGQVLGCVRQAGVLVDGVVTDDRRVVAVAVTTLRVLGRFLGPAAPAVELVTLEMLDCFDDHRQVAPGHG